MNKLGTRIGVTRLWRHFYFSPFSLDKSFPIPYYGLNISNTYLEKILSGFITGPIHITRYRDKIIVYLHTNSFSSFYPFISYLPKLFGSKIIFKPLYTFTIDDALLFIQFLPKKEQLVNLVLSGKVKGLKLLLNGRFNGRPRSSSDLFVFGQVPNTSSSNLSSPLPYAHKQLLFKFGTNSLHVFLNF